jgi:hypothetical protein
MNGAFDENKTTRGGTDKIVAPAAPSGPIFAPGQLISDKYRVIEFIGHGAAGFVYKVEQVFMLRRFALKLFDGRNSGNAVIRFQKEAQMSGLLDHPNLVRATDFGVLDGDQPFLVMDLVDGPTLDSLLKARGAIPLTDVLTIIKPVCAALEYAHGKGLIHRDIKPGNIMLDGYSSNSLGTPKVVDFGIAKLLQDTGLSLTQTGEVFGTPLYMSPEQCTGHAVDIRSDIYSLGCVFYEMLTGAPPFRGAGMVETVSMHIYNKPMPLREASLGQAIAPAYEYMVQKMLAKDPADRYQNCGQVLQDLIAAEKGALLIPQEAKSSFSGIENRAGQAGKTKIVTRAVPAVTPAQGRTKKILTIAGLSVCALLVLGAAGYIGFMAARNDRSADVVSSGTAAAPVAASQNAVGAKKDSDSQSPKPEATAASSTKMVDGPMMPPIEVLGDVSQQMAPAGVHFAKKYLASDPAASLRVFYFPIEASLGTLDIIDATGMRLGDVNARGQCAPPANCRLELHLNLALFAKYPDKVLAPFDEGDLWGLKFSPDGRYKFVDPKFNDNLRYAARLKKLGNLRIECELFSDAGFKNLQIQNMTQLTQLSIRGGKVDVRNVAALPGWMLNNLRELELENLPGPINSVLEKLFTNSRMYKLILPGNDLNDESLELISKIRTLEELNISRNPKITAAGLKALASMPRLSHLQLQGTTIAPKDIGAITAIPHLKYLCVNDKLWFKSDLEELHRRMPKLLVQLKSLKGEDQGALKLHSLPF